jgi:hypothetical protein
MSTHEKMQRPDYEGDDVNFSAIRWVVIMFVIVAVAVHVGVWWLFRYVRAEDERRSVRRSLVETQPPIPPEPRLQVNPTIDFQEYLRAQREALNSYGWVSRGEGRVRIPIDRAIEIVVEREKR